MLEMKGYGMTWRAHHWKIQNSKYTKPDLISNLSKHFCAMLMWIVSDTKTEISSQSCFSDFVLD